MQRVLGALNHSLIHLLCAAHCHSFNPDLALLARSFTSCFHVGGKFSRKYNNVRIDMICLDLIKFPLPTLTSAAGILEQASGGSRFGAELGARLAHQRLFIRIMELGTNPFRRRSPTRLTKHCGRRAYEVDAWRPFTSLLALSLPMLTFSFALHCSHRSRVKRLADSLALPPSSWE